ncbi:transglycosylase SLT domain-containing protein [Candidatus Parcubacteria bacterium]|nr:transglycosylase SLT domain-containing protein [Candidatus Parcubacteria bacterium]
MKFGFEKPGNSLESKDESAEEKKLGMNRRDFLKGLAISTVAITTGCGVEELLGEKKEAETEIKKWKQKESMKKKTRRKDGKKESKDLKETTPVERRVEAKNIADIFLKAYYELSCSKRWPPNDILNSNFYIAQTLTESNMKPKAQSGAGAKGIMQNMPISVVDVVAYLNKLKRNNEFNYQGPEHLKKEEIEEVMDLILEKADYSRAFGKLYLCALWDQGYGYSVGKKHYERGDIKTAQMELLGSYNGGYRRVRNEPKRTWPKESRDYADEAMNYIERLKRIRNRFNDFGINLEVKYEDYAAALMAREMDKPKKLEDKYKLLDKYARIIKSTADERGDKIIHEDLRLIFEK